MRFRLRPSGLLAPEDRRGAEGEVAADAGVPVRHSVDSASVAAPASVAAAEEPAPVDPGRGPVQWSLDPVSGRRVYSALYYVPPFGTSAYERWEREQDAERELARAGRFVSGPSGV